MDEAHPSISLDGKSEVAHRGQKCPADRVLDTDGLLMGTDGDSAGRDDPRTTVAVDGGERRGDVKPGPT